MMIEMKDFLPGSHLVNAGLARLQLQLDAANSWIAQTPGVRVLNVETLFGSSIVSGSGVVTNVEGRGVRVWFSRHA